LAAAGAASARGAEAGGAAATELPVEVKDVATDGRLAKINSRVRNSLNETVHGIRYLVKLTPPDAQRVLDSFQREVDLTVEPGRSASVRLDVQSMYFGSGGGTRFYVQAFPVRVGDRDVPPPPDWR
jgi:hypothetical protein